jgi:hypothetical protein
VALRVALSLAGGDGYCSGRSCALIISDRHACSDFSSPARAGRRPNADRHLDLDSAAQCDSYYKLYGHHAAKEHGDLRVAANRHPHCAGLADPYANAKPDSYMDSDAFTVTRTPSSYGDTGAEIGMKLAFQCSR